MKELKLWQKIGVVALFALVAFSASFSTYELLFDKADAGVLIRCSGTSCSGLGKECGNESTCICSGNEMFANCIPYGLAPQQ